LEKYRGECARLASVRDEAARGSFRAENECLATARDAAETAAHAVEKMRVSEAAAAKAYDVASLRERVLRDELDKAVGAGRSDDADGISTETQRRIQDAKNTCDWAAGLEEGRKAQERSVEEAKRLLIVAEDRARETLKDAGDTYGEFARMTEGSYFISQIYYIHHKCPVPPDYSDLNPPYSTPMRRATRD
jgi:hypothetical protein